MKTLSATEARANITQWLDRALDGQSIGITHKGRIIKLQPVPVIEDWAAAEYGLTSAELDRAAENLVKAGKKLLEARKAVICGEFKGGH